MLFESYIFIQKYFKYFFFLIYLFGYECSF